MCRVYTCDLNECSSLHKWKWLKDTGPSKDIGFFKKENKGTLTEYV